MSIVLVGGALANKPLNGGAAWIRLSWVLGRRRLGFGVYFVEQITRETCVDGTGTAAAFEDSVNFAHFRSVIEEFGLADTSSLIWEGGEQTYGLGMPELADL